MSPFLNIEREDINQDLVKNLHIHDIVTNIKCN